MYGVTSYLLISTAITTLLEKAKILLAYADSSYSTYRRSYDSGKYLTAQIREVPRYTTSACMLVIMIGKYLNE